MLAARLYLLAFLIWPAQYGVAGVDYATARDTAESIEAAVAPVEDVERRAEIAEDMERFSFCESRWRSNITGAAGDVGVMQTLPRWLTVPVADVLASRRVGYEQALRIVLDGYHLCGSRDGAWRYYAGGSCEARGALVWRRLHGGKC